jgi:hypothetical protein
MVSINCYMFRHLSTVILLFRTVTNKCTIYMHLFRLKHSKFNVSKLQSYRLITSLMMAVVQPKHVAL